MLMVSSSSMVFVLVLFTFVASIAGQKCMNGCLAGLSTCSIITYNLYVNDTSSVLATEANVTEFIYQATNLAALVKTGLVDAQCQNALYMLLCNVLHPSCDPNSPTPTPILPCIDMCYQANTYCGPIKDFLPPYVGQYFNCNGTDENGAPLYSSSDACSNVTTTTLHCLPLLPDVPKYTGKCQKFNPILAPRSYKMCAPFTTEDIYVPMDWPMVQSLLELYSANSVLNVEQYYPVMPLDCYQNLISVLCVTAYPPCVSVNVSQYNAAFGVPVKPCKSLCNLSNQTCNDFLHSIGKNSTIVQCPTTVNGTYTTKITSSQSLVLNCSTDIFPANPVVPFTIPPVDTCPPETGKKTHKLFNDSYCELRCPDASYTLDEWKTLSQIVIVGSVFSLVTMSFLTISYLLQHDRRKFPSSIHFWEFVATALFAISFLIGGRTPEKTTWCFDEGTNATQDNNSRCAVQGFFFIYFGIALTAWCCVIAFMMFYAIVFDQKIQNLRKYSPFFHLFGWGVPLAFAVAAVATKSVGYGPPLAWCFIHFEGFGFVGNGNGLSKDYVFFYIPEAVLFFSILFMFIATVAKIIYVRRNHISHSSVAKAGSRTFQAQVRILIFIFMVFVICFTIFEWRLQIERSSTVAAIGLQWTYCKIRTYILSQEDPSCLGEHNPARIDYRHTAFESFVLSGIGILIFIGFGADPNIYKHWYKLFRLAYAKEWAKMRELVIDGKDPFKTSKSRGTSDNSNSGSGSKTSITMSDRTRSSDHVTDRARQPHARFGRAHRFVRGRLVWSRQQRPFPY